VSSTVRALTLLLVVAAVMVAIGAVLAWPRDDPLSAPDAVAVLGGAGTERLELGRALAARHDAVLVLSSSAIVFGERGGLSCGREVVCIEPEPETTTGEARTVAALAAERGWDHVAVATSRFHTTRARVLFRQCLDDRVSVLGASRPDGSWSPGASGFLRELAGTGAALTFRRAC
jgi:uncharacterized SAM-binding protein YcdF (DUF218 family)